MHMLARFLTLQKTSEVDVFCKIPSTRKTGKQNLNSPEHLNSIESLPDACPAPAERVVPKTSPETPKLGRSGLAMNWVP